MDKEVGAAGFRVKDRVGRAGLHQLLEIILFRQGIIYCIVGDPKKILKISRNQNQPQH